VSETPKKVNLDLALREWPEAEKSAVEWDEMARTIDERVARGDLGASVAYVTERNLLSEPLGQTPGEGHNSAAPLSAGSTSRSEGKPMTMPVDRERDRRSLQDLAKMASMTPAPPSAKVPQSNPSGVQRAAEAKKDDSGIVDLALASQADPQAAVRAQSTPLAQDGLFDDEPASIRPGPVSQGPVSQAPFSQPQSHQALQQPAPSIPPMSVAPVSQAPVSAAPSSGMPAIQSSAISSSVRALPAANAKKGNGAVIALVFGGLVALSAAAAGGFVFLKHRAESAAKGAIAMNDPAPAAAPASKPAEPAPAQAAPEPTPAPEGTLDPNALPTATPNNGKVAAAPKGALALAPARPAAPNEKPAAKTEGPKISEKDLPTAPSVPEGDLTKAMGKAVGADGKPLEATPAAGNTGPQFAAGSVPQKPSQGAVTGAIGAVLPGARACLGPDDPISRASITFTSSGTVQSVSVSGGAAGKPAEACIKGALMKAKLTPFAEPTYTAPVTIRHN
jgi:hypothetical protein